MKTLCMINDSWRGDGSWSCPVEARTFLFANTASLDWGYKYLRPQLMLNRGCARVSSVEYSLILALQKLLCCVPYISWHAHHWQSLLHVLEPLWVLLDQPAPCSRASPRFFDFLKKENVLSEGSKLILVRISLVTTDSWSIHASAIPLYYGEGYRNRSKVWVDAF